MIGDMSLSEKARQLEMAAKEGRLEYIRENHHQAMEEYTKLTEAVSLSFGTDNYDEVLEFLPDSDIIEFEAEGEKRRSLQDSFHGQIILYILLYRQNSRTADILQLLKHQEHLTMLQWSIPNNFRAVREF